MRSWKLVARSKHLGRLRQQAAVQHYNIPPDSKMSQPEQSDVLHVIDSGMARAVRVHLGTVPWLRRLVYMSGPYRGSGG